MCQIESILQVLHEDMEVYKLVRRCGKNYMGLFMSKIYELGKKAWSTDFEDEINKKDFSPYLGNIEGGFIHCFPDKFSLIGYAADIKCAFGRGFFDNIAVIKCIIPAGTKIYKGTTRYWANFVDSVATPVLIPKEEIDKTAIGI